MRYIRIYKESERDMLMKEEKLQQLLRHMERKAEGRAVKIIDWAVSKYKKRRRSWNCGQSGFKLEKSKRQGIMGNDQRASKQLFRNNSPYFRARKKHVSSYCFTKTLRSHNTFYGFLIIVFPEIHQVCKMFFSC